MSRRVAALSMLAAGLLVAVIAVTRPAGDAESGPAPERPAPRADAPPDDVGKGEGPPGDAALEARFERVVSSMWWHLPRFERLELSARQVERMDALCLDMLNRRYRLRQTVRSMQPAWREALARLETKEARRRLQELGEVAAQLALLEELLVLDVLSLLERGQLEILRSDHPAILQRPWFKTLAPRQGADPRNAPQSGTGGDASESAPARPAS